MKSWTRTLNLDDTHTLLALADPGTSYDDWVRASHKDLQHLSMPRRRELVRILRHNFLKWDGEFISTSLFMDFYGRSHALAQINLVDLQWALTHDLSLIAAEQLVAPALQRDDAEIPLTAVEELVRNNIETPSAESLRKTRTTLLGALEGVGAIVTRGTGQHRSLRASRGEPSAMGFGFLIHLELSQRGVDGMMAREVIESSLPVRLTQCDMAHSQRCVAACIEQGVLVERDDEIGIPTDFGKR